MNIDSIRNGYVLDHIKAGASMEIYRLLGLDKLDCSVAIIKNAKSTKLGRKDIIKIDALIDLDLDVLGYVDPDITVSIIKDGVFKTHPTDHYILPGITRMHIIQICKDNGIIVDETPFTMAELMDADEIIVSSSTKFCSPVCEMNGTPIGGKAPELVDLIQKKYTEKFENETM